MPLPEDFPSGSQVSIGCNYTGRLFSRLENGLKWDGPWPSAIFTCVSGKWVGEPGAVGVWQHLENLTCLQCIQLGTPECQFTVYCQMPLLCGTMSCTLTLGLKAF